MAKEPRVSDRVYVLELKAPSKRVEGERDFMRKEEVEREVLREMKNNVLLNPDQMYDFLIYDTLSHPLGPGGRKVEEKRETSLLDIRLVTILKRFIQIPSATGFSNCLCSA